MLYWHLSILLQVWHMFGMSDSTILWARFFGIVPRLSMVPQNVHRASLVRNSDRAGACGRRAQLHGTFSAIRGCFMPFWGTKQSVNRMQTGSRLLKSVPKANFYPQISFLMSKITQTKYFALNLSSLGRLGCSRLQNHLHFGAPAGAHGVLSSQPGGGAIKLS